MDKQEKAIIDKFNWGQDSLVTQSSDLSLKSIADMIHEGVIDISPKYQRRDRWDSGKQAELIESFLLNIPVPPIYLAETEAGDYSVIDGKQRLTAIYQFIYKGLKLKGLERFTEIEGYTFKKLPSTLSGPIKVRPYLRVVTLLQQSDPELKHEVFLRLNKSGVRLNSQEIRNVAYRGDLNDMLIGISGSKFLKVQLNAVPGKKMYTEMTDVQFVLRAFTLLEHWDNFPGNMDVAMDKFMDKHHRDSVSEVKKMKSLFLEALVLCERIWGDKSFHKPEGKNMALQGFYDIHLVPLMLLSRNKRIEIEKKKGRVRQAIKNALKKDEKYLDSIVEFTSNPERVKYRIGNTLRILKMI